jgi:hypothetical protein
MIEHAAQKGGAMAATKERNRDHVLYVEIEPELLTQLKRMAKTEDRTLKSVVERVIRAGLEKGR